MNEAARGLYRLSRIDGHQLPLRLSYRHTRCSVTAGHAQLVDDSPNASDGSIIITLEGVMSGRSEVRQIFMECEPFDQLNRRYLTFPGGWRRYGRTVRPHGVVWCAEDELVLTMLRPLAARAGLAPIFGDHEWRFTRERLDSVRASRASSG